MLLHAPSTLILLILSNSVQDNAKYNFRRLQAVIPLSMSPKTSKLKYTSWQHVFFAAMHSNYEQNNYCTHNGLTYYSTQASCSGQQKQQTL